MTNFTTAPPPEWIDAKAARAIFCLSRATLYRLAEAGRIRTTSLRERGQVKGRRLFSYDSIKALLESRATGGEALAIDGKGGAA